MFVPLKDKTIENSFASMPRKCARLRRASAADQYFSLESILIAAASPARKAVLWQIGVLPLAEEACCSWLSSVPPEHGHHMCLSGADTMPGAPRMLARWLFD